MRGILASPVSKAHDYAQLIYLQTYLSEFHCLLAQRGVTIFCETGVKYFGIGKFTSHCGKLNATQIR
jgi:hypothetical protein